jgi:Ferritin-like domain
VSISRNQLLVSGAAFAVFTPALVNTMAEAASGASPGDIAILNSEIALENAGVKAYRDAASLKLLSAPVLAVAMSFVSDHLAHIGALSAAVKAAGATPTAETAKLEYPMFKTEADILAFAEKVERLAATSYLKDIEGLKDPKLARLMASIMGVETTHVTILSEALKQPRPYAGFVA